MPVNEATVDHLLAAADVPGLASAIIRAGQLDRTICCGVRDVRSPAPIDAETVFDAASLSKPVFAHAVLQLSDQGVLSLDTPLTTYLPGYMQADQRASSITARHVLSHSAGLPNWRNDDLPLKTYFAPGERFSYSGEGFLYLQKAAEALTGEKLHSLAERMVFRPFGMNRSSFIWDWRFDPNRAAPHDDFGRPAISWKPRGRQRRRDTPDDRRRLRPVSPARTGRLRPPA
jgi:CubicO group peptidase (beta-lactamase class C family)